MIVFQGGEIKVNCLIVPQGDSEALARTIKWAYQHQQELCEIGCRGRILYQQNYSVMCIKTKIARLLL